MQRQRRRSDGVRLNNHPQSTEAILMPRIRSMLMSLLRLKINARPRLPGSTIAAVATIIIALSGHGAWSQAARTIRIIVPFPPGGAADILARVLSEEIARTQGLA